LGPGAASWLSAASAQVATVIKKQQNSLGDDMRRGAPELNL
jgi:hypothetical protein